MDIGWASSVVITLTGLGPEQKWLRLMSSSFWRIIWPPLTFTLWTWGGSPSWLSPWQAWDQNKKCLGWWADHFEVFFDQVWPPPNGQKLLSLMSSSLWHIFWPRPTSNWWTWGGPPLWFSPWQAWDQTKSCLAWWADHFDVFFDRLWPPPSGHRIGLLRGYHPDRLGTKTKVA